MKILSLLAAAVVVSTMPVASASAAPRHGWHNVCHWEGHGHWRHRVCHRQHW